MTNAPHHTTPHHTTPHHTTPRHTTQCLTILLLLLLALLNDPTRTHAHDPVRHARTHLCRVRYGDRLYKFSTLPKSVQSCFLMLLGDFDYEEMHLVAPSELTLPRPIAC